MILQHSQYSYEFIYHTDPIRSVQDGVKHFGIDPGQTAPTLIVKTEKGFVAMTIAGSRGRVNFEEVAKLIGCNKVKLASRTEVKSITGFDIGNIPLVGISLSFIIDQRLFEYPLIYGGSGQINHTLKIDPHALVELNKVVAMMI